MRQIFVSTAVTLKFEEKGVSDVLTRIPMLIFIVALVFLLIAALTLPFLGKRGIFLVGFVPIPFIFVGRTNKAALFFGLLVVGFLLLFALALL